ncbi:MAG: hypothetical protein GY856_54975 [bacterium]|nr:hypothetical protein [bacterium]
MISQGLNSVVDRIAELTQVMSAQMTTAATPGPQMDLSPYLAKLDETMTALVEAPRGGEVVQMLDPGVFDLLARMSATVGDSLLPLVQSLGRYVTSSGPPSRWRRRPGWTASARRHHPRPDRDRIVHRGRCDRPGGHRHRAGRRRRAAISHRHPAQCRCQPHRRRAQPIARALRKPPRGRCPLTVLGALLGTGAHGRPQRAAPKAHIGPLDDRRTMSINRAGSAGFQPARGLSVGRWNVLARAGSAGFQPARGLSVARWDFLDRTGSAE